jgi:DNA processing protein
VSGWAEGALFPSGVEVRTKYQPPQRTHSIGLWRALEGAGRRVPPSQYDRLIAFGQHDNEGEAWGPTIYFSGDITLVQRPAIAIVGARKVSREGAALAAQVSSDMVSAGFVVVSGLAQGVDCAAHKAAMAAGGQTIAVIGTPLDRAYPNENASLQEQIYRDHLLISPFVSGRTVQKANFPHRNKVMAALCDATVIIEASDTSGTLHQATECRSDRLDRWLFISQRVVDNRRLSWPAKFLESTKSRARVFRTAADIVGVLNSELPR